MGGKWFRYGEPGRECFFSEADLVPNGAEVYKKLTRLGFSMRTAEARQAFHDQVDEYEEFVDAILAFQPGYDSRCFVLGNGDVVKSPVKNAPEVIVLFEKNSKFDAVGSLDDWNNRIAPFVAGQGLLLFAVAFAFVGPILEFAPADYSENPVVELCGAKEAGKSTALALAASVWAGDRHSNVGGAQTWNFSPEAVERIRLTHAATLLGLDEVKLFKGSPNEFVGMLWRLAATDGRDRYGEPAPKPVRLACLSSTNSSVSEIAEGDGETLAALKSRVVTLMVPPASENGIFTKVPDGFASTRAAIETLKGIVKTCYGTAGRAFVAHLLAKIEKDDTALRQQIQGYLNDFIGKQLEGLPARSARIEKTFALTYAAGRLARDAGILPDAWKGLGRILRDLYLKQSREGHPALQPIHAYIEAQQGRIVDQASLAEPVSPEVFATSAGFIGYHQGDRYLYVPTPVFQDRYPDYRGVCKKLAKAGLLRTESGKQRKSSIKTPSGFAKTGRVYAIKI